MMGVAIGVFAFGQTTELAKSPYKVMRANEATELTVAPAPTSTNRSADGNGAEALGAIWFTETFGAGLAGDGSNGAWTTSGTVSGAADPDAVWEYRGTATTPSNAIGSRGAYSGAQAPVASPTTANGFFIFDSDYRDNAGVAGNFGGGDAPTPHMSWLTSSSFSTMGSNDVSVRFNTYFRRFQGTAYLLLSIDGGATWGDSVTIMDADWPVNDASAEDVVIVEKVPFIENQANVAISFFFDGETESNANGSGYYFVMVDDVVIGDAPDNDLVLGENYYQTGYDTAWNRYYSRVPEMFTSFDSIQVSAWVTNNGGADQVNTVLTNEIFYNGSLNSTMVSPSGMTLASGSSDSLVIPGFYSFDSGIGEYAMVYSTSSDSTEDIPSNNTADTVFVAVTDSTYSRDFQASGNYWFGAGETYEIGPTFDIYQDAKVTSVSVAVGPASTHGDVFSIYIYDMSTDLTVPLVSREFIFVDSNTVDFLNSYSVTETILPAGTYVVTVKTYSDEVYFRRSSFEGNTGMAIVDVSASGTFGWTSAVPAIRLNLSNDLCDVVATAVQTGNNTASVTATGGTLPYTYMWDNGETTAIATNLQSGVTHSVTVSDAGTCTGVATADIVDGVQNIELNQAVSLYPNPNNGEFTLSFNGLNGVYTVTVRNAVGQIITTENVNVSGDINKNMSNSDLSKGVYFVEVSDTTGDRTIIRFVVK